MPAWTVTIAQTRTIPSKDVAAKVLGRDIAFGRGDYSVTAGDWTTIEGAASVRESLYRRVTSPPRSFPFRPTYGGGVRAQVNAPLDQGNIDQTASRVRSQAKSDQRVREARVTVERRGVGVANVILEATLRQVSQSIAPLEIKV
jgi:phage baseplate assembly protein W